MQLKLQQLRNVVKRARDNEKAVSTLRTEVKRVLGPIMDVDCKLESLAEQVNDRISVMNHTGRTAQYGFKPASVVPFMNHDNAEVRTMAANLVPQRFLTSMKDDPHSMVRAVVAQRAEMAIVREMMKRFPRDDELRSIYRLRQKEVQLNEAGLPNPEVVDEPFDMYGEERMGDASKTPDSPLTDEWYAQTARNLFQKYDKNVEFNWEENAVNNLIHHTKATSGVEIDGEKLLDALNDYIEEYEDDVLENGAGLKEIVQRLNKEADLLDESANLYTDDSDPVRSLIESHATPGSFLKEASKLFQVRESTVPMQLKKYRRGDLSLKIEQTIPMKAKLPHNGAPRALDEQALDLYVKYWNEHQSVQGEPIRIKWSSHPSDESVIGFQAVLR